MHLLGPVFLPPAAAPAAPRRLPRQHPRARRHRLNHPRAVRLQRNLHPVANRRQVGSCFGLTGTPYDSGESQRDQGISKAGNRRARALAIELAWLWVRHQPDSDLTRWFSARVGELKGRIRRINIVALARKLMVALWRYLTTGVVPAGAVLRPGV